MRLRVPWSRSAKTESRSQAGAGGYADAINRLLENSAAGQEANIASTAAVEAAAGTLGRTLSDATVKTESALARSVITPGFLRFIGRQLVTVGETMHYIDYRNGVLSLIPCASWNWENPIGDARAAAWRCRITYFGPSSSVTKVVPAESVVFNTWGVAAAGVPYRGASPLAGAYLTAKLAAEAERSIGDELAGPVAQLLVVPDNGPGATGDGDADDADDPHSEVKRNLRLARGDGVLLESTSHNYADGAGGAPRRDWESRRLGPAPTEASVMARRDSFAMILAAAGIPPAMWTDGADGTAQRAARERMILLTVKPILRLLAAELTQKLETEVSFDVTHQQHDVQVKAAALRKMIESGVLPADALAMSGLLLPDGDE